ncbi:MAG: hypothetical protein HY826_05185 [Actinobacteria bacterium]|nr:hypothetical protein [Actinomycetota bacterium]
MTGLARVLGRLTADPEFADEIRRDPSTALHDFDLDANEVARLERVLSISISPLARE